MKLQTVSLNVTFHKASKQCVKKHVQKTLKMWFHISSNILLHD